MDANETYQFIDACRRGQLQEVEALYQQNTSLLNCTDARGFTPLIIAVYNDQPEVADFLLLQGAEADQQDLSGNTALMGACFKGYTDIVKKLIAAGADVNAVNGNNVCALSFAATFGRLEIAEILLQHGAHVDIRDVRGKSPLHHAIIQEVEPMIALLQRYAPAGNSNE